MEDHDKIKSDLKVSEFIQNNKWNIYKLSHYIRNQDIVHKIIGISLPISSTRDSFYWGLSSTGDFTTNSATWLALDHPQEEEQ